MAEMSKVTLRLKGIAPLLYGRPVFDEKRPNESHDQLEERTWKQRALVDDDGRLCIAAVAVHKSLCAGGKWLGMKIKGEGKKTYTKRFESGIIQVEPMCPVHNGKQDLTIDDIERERLFVPPTQNAKTRVWRNFPKLKPGWWIEPSFIVTDEKLTEDVIFQHAKCAGMHDGLGSMRIGCGGPNGMYTAEVVAFEPYDLFA